VREWSQRAALQLAVTASFIPGDGETSLASKETAWSIPGRLPKGSYKRVFVVYGINFEMFLTSYISVACQVCHSDISALHKWIYLGQNRSALFLFTLRVKLFKSIYCAVTTCYNLHSSVDPEFL